MSATGNKFAIAGSIRTIASLSGYIWTEKFRMKRLLVLSIIILFTLCVRAQTGMPKELTCTETAFNFSFSVGSGWKLTAPKMGPVEIQGNDADYNSLWRLKVKEVTAQTSSLPFLIKQR